MSYVEQVGPIDQVALLEAQIARARALHKANRKDVSKAKREALLGCLRYIYRCFHTRLRVPERSYSLWPIGVTLVSSLAAGEFAVILLEALADSWALAIVGGIATVLLTASWLWNLFRGLTDGELESLVQDHLSTWQTKRKTACRLQLQSLATRRALKDVEEAWRAIKNSVSHERHALLNQDWRSFRGAEWEVFLLKAFELAGAKVRAVGQTGDQGVDLIAEWDDRCYAIQAKGYSGAVNNSAVQEAVAGMAYWGCNRSAVVTNSYFTRGAIALAESNGCLMIGASDIPSLVEGRLSL